MKKGFSLIEVMIVLALSLFLTGLVFNLSTNFIIFFRRSYRSVHDACKLSIALQRLRADLMQAPGDRNLYVQLSEKVITYYLSNKTRISWQFDDDHKKLKRIHYLKNKKGETHDNSLVLEQVEGSFNCEEFPKYFSVSLAHNGKFFKIFIKIRNGKL